MRIGLETMLHRSVQNSPFNLLYFGHSNFGARLIEMKVEFRHPPLCRGCRSLPTKLFLQWLTIFLLLCLIHFFITLTYQKVCTRILASENCSPFLFVDKVREFYTVRPPFPSSEEFFGSLIIIMWLHVKQDSYSTGLPTQNLFSLHSRCAEHTHQKPVRFSPYQQATHQISPKYGWQ